MRRFFQPAGPASDGSIVLVDAEAQHAALVIRLRVGEPASVLDGAGREFHCTATAVDRREVRLRVDRTVQKPRPQCRIRLVQAISKGKSFELILQKAVELGASEIQPLITERVVARPGPGDAADKLARWQQVAVEAMKQCGAGWLPRVLEPCSLAAAIAGDAATELKLIGALSPAAAHIRSVLDSFRQQHNRLPGTLSFWIGPEGDFTGAELMELERASVLPVTLGSQVLRSETAALYALAVLGHEFSYPH